MPHHRLAPELMDAIVAYLPPRDLRSSALVCKMWMIIASPHLLRRVCANDLVALPNPRKLPEIFYRAVKDSTRLAFCIRDLSLVTASAPLDLKMLRAMLSVPPHLRGLRIRATTISAADVHYTLPAKTGLRLDKLSLDMSQRVDLHSALAFFNLFYEIDVLDVQRLWLKTDLSTIQEADMPAFNKLRVRSILIDSARTSPKLYPHDVRNGVLLIRALLDADVLRTVDDHSPGGYFFSLRTTQTLHPHTLFPRVEFCSSLCNTGWNGTAPLTFAPYPNLVGALLATTAHFAVNNISDDGFTGWTALVDSMSTLSPGLREIGVVLDVSPSFEAWFESGVFDLVDDIVPQVKALSWTLFYQRLAALQDLNTVDVRIRILRLRMSERSVDGLQKAVEDVVMSAMSSRRIRDMVKFTVELFV